MQPLIVHAFPYKTYALSEGAITIEVGHSIGEDTFNRVNGLNARIIQNPFPGFKTTLPAYTTLTVFFDPLRVLLSVQLKGGTCFERISNYLDQLGDIAFENTQPVNNTVTIPVCYGGAFGPDMDFVAGHSLLQTDEVIRLHTAAVYKVYMLGFVPGFAYLGGLPEQLVMPRKAIPRKAVPVGSVGIAGMQTGVYPFQSPGGWQIIGRTPVKMFDAKAKTPVLLKPGDNVVFKSVSEAEFNEMAGRDDAD